MARPGLGPAQRASPPRCAARRRDGGAPGPARVPRPRHQCRRSRGELARGRPRLPRLPLRDRLDRPGRGRRPPRVPDARPRRHGRGVGPRDLDDGWRAALRLRRVWAPGGHLRRGWAGHPGSGRGGARRLRLSACSRRSRATDRQGRGRGRGGWRPGLRDADGARQTGLRRGLRRLGQRLQPRAHSGRRHAG